mgnify:CR=1 FL=1
MIELYKIWLGLLQKVESTSLFAYTVLPIRNSPVESYLSFIFS